METRVIDNNEGIVIKRVQDVESIVNFAADKRKAGEVGTPDMKLAAEFPAVLVENYCITAGITFNEFLANPVHVKRMLSDPALKAFRIWEGRV